MNSIINWDDQVLPDVRESVGEEPTTLSEEHIPNLRRGAEAQDGRYIVGPLTHVCLASVQEIAREQEQWDALLAGRYDSNPCLTLDWHLLWLKHFAGSGVEIHYIKVSDDRGVLAYFPFVVKKDRFHGLPVKTLRYAGNMYSPIYCPLIADIDPSPVFDYVVQKVLPDIDWSLFRALDLPDELPGVQEMLTALQKAGYPTFPEKGDGIWIFDQPGVTSSEYFKQLPTHRRADLRRYPRKLAEIGELRYRIVRGDDLQETDILAYQAVYARSWKEPEFAPAFHPELMRAAAERGWLRLSLLYLDERPIASQFWLCRQARGYPLQMAYDEEFRAYSPGTLLSWRMIEQLMDEEGMEFINYGGGGEKHHSYKKWWTNQWRPSCSLLCFRPGGYGSGLRLLDRNVLPWIRANRVLNTAKRQVARLLGN
jgi:CelD/BcsL family acetyltransferase involved in cellulose biosynthesis